MPGAKLKGKLNGHLRIGGVRGAPLLPVHGAQRQVVETAHFRPAAFVHVCALHLDHRVPSLQVSQICNRQATKSDISCQS